MIIVSLTTIPERLEKGLPRKCIESILKQTVQPDIIVVNIPSVSRKNKPYSQTLANELSSLNPNPSLLFGSIKTIIKVQYGIKDLGPITKLIPTLNLISSMRQNMEIHPLIILVDDDCIYDSQMIENLVKFKTDTDEMAIGQAGRKNIKNVLEFFSPESNITDDVVYVDILEAYAGVLYDYQLFKDQEQDFNEYVMSLPSYVLNADDIIIASWVKKNGKKLCKIGKRYPNVVLQDAKGTPELYKDNLFGGNNDKSYDFLEDYYERRKRELQFKKLLEKSHDDTFIKFAGQGR